MFENFFIQFIVELIRAALVDELSGRVRRRAWRLLRSGVRHDIRGIVFGLHRRTRKRLLHRVVTDADAEP